VAGSRPSDVHAPNGVQGERRAVVDAIEPFHQASANELADVAHPQPLHHRTRPPVVPALYVDNGSAFASKQLERACAVLGIRLIHSRPAQPAGRGKIERVFRTVREQFLVELDARGGAEDLAELNRLFQAWVEGVYHRRTHSETGQPPLERFLAGFGDQAPKPAVSRRAARRLPVGRAAAGDQDRRGLPARQPLPGRPRPGRRQRGTGLRPLRPHPAPGPLPGPRHGHRDTSSDRPPRPPGRQARTAQPTTSADRHRLPRPGRATPGRSGPPAHLLRAAGQ
jgi:hypothetical protein